MSKTIAIWGSPNSGKTTFATKLAETIYEKYQATVIVLYADNETPALPVVFPNYKKEDMFSVGVTLAKTEIDICLKAKSITKQLTCTRNTLKDGPEAYFWSKIARILKICPVLP